MALLEVKGLYKEFTKGKTRFAAVDHIDLQVEAGECLGLVGESGCGKSTTAQLILHLLKADGGEIWFDNKLLKSNSDMKEVRSDLQMIFQNPVDSFDPRCTLLNGVKQGLRFFDNPGKDELDRRAKDAISFVGLKESYHKRRICQLSGGECQRAAIARAILAQPKLIICDEATSALDVSVQAQVIDLLKRLKAEKQMSYLFITHDLMLAHAMCDRIAVMYRGEIVESGTAEQILKSPAHPYTKMLLSCVLPPRVTKEFHFVDCSPVRQEASGGCKFYEYCPNASAKCSENAPTLEMQNDRQVACFYPQEQ
ncbi:MAG: ABC transporter ATP-binding protein [Oscillospiraceae bacterium]|nr:ABC transporter ATP-binding protein [Oscillospiraceae bacterium]